MVGPAFETGSIVVPIRARVEQLRRGLSDTVAQVNRFGDALTNRSRQIDVATERMSRGIATANKRLAVFGQRAATGTQRLLSLQLVVQQFGSRVGIGKFGKEVATATDALIAFAAIVSIFPSKLGLVIGSIASLGIVIAALVGPTTAQKEEMERLNAAVDSSVGTFNAFKKGLQETNQELRLVAELADEFEIFGAEERVREFNSRLRDQESAIRTIVLATRALRDINEKLGSDTVKLSKDEKNKLEFQKAVIEGELRLARVRLGNTGSFIAQERELAEQRARGVAILDELNTTLDATQDRFQRIKEAVEAGLITPVDAAAERLKVFQERLLAIARFEAERAQLQPQFRPEPITLADPAKAASDAADELERELRPERFARSFSEPFGMAIGDAVFDGILQGKEAMEVVADVGRNLFANFLDTSIEGFQKGMTEAFGEIAGAGGEALGNLFTGLAGIAGFFLSGGARGDADTAFAGVRSAVDSSQAVRGIVAGPSNIAIAQVGENLERALVPTNQLLEQILAEITQVNVNTAGGPAGGGGGAFPVAGAVATP